MASELVLDAGVPQTSKENLAELAADPVVEDWLISTTENQGTKDSYLWWLGRFLKWAQWTPAEVFRIKKAALKEGEPISEVEIRVRRFHETLRRQGYAGKTRGQAVTALYSFIGSKGYTIKKRLVRMDMSNKLEMRVPTKEEVEAFIQYAASMEKKLLYTLMVETPCRPRVFPALRWNWLEPDWSTKDFVYVNLPREFRPSTQSGPRKFEPCPFLGPRGIALLKQFREAHIKKHTVPPEDSDKILPLTYDSVRMTVQRDYRDLVKLGLVRASRKDEKGVEVEQPITAKSWRKYQFNIIDSLVEISPEWRKMLKGRDLQTERYYSKENIEALRKIYQEKIYPQLWSDTGALHETETIKQLRQEVEELKPYKHKIEELELVVRMLQDSKR